MKYIDKLIAEGGQKIMKRTYETPVACVEKFMPNEYVAACWGVACDWSWANQYEQNHHNWHNGDISHAADHCGNSSNQVIMDYNDDGIGDRMIETGTDGLGNLNCTIYTDANYRNTINVSTVQIGQEIYWTTRSGSRTWHHKGTVTATAEGHPNRS